MLLGVTFYTGTSVDIALMVCEEAEEEEWVGIQWGQVRAVNGQGGRIAVLLRA